MTDFAKTISEGYSVEGAAIDLGRGVHEGNLEPEAMVRLPLKTMNRHGLIAGATGTGKTRTLQLIAEQLSEQGVAVFAADYKGDLSGLREPGAADRLARPARAARVHARGRGRAAQGRPHLPEMEFYDLEELLTSLGTGEAAVTVLSEKGVPTPVVHTRLRGSRPRQSPKKSPSSSRSGGGRRRPRPRATP